MNVIELGNKISETTIPKTHVKSTRKQAYLTVKWFTIKKLTHAHKPTCKYAKNSLIPSTITRQCFESHSPYEEPHRESRTFTRWAWVNTDTLSRCVVRCWLSSMCVILLNWPQGSPAAPHQNISTDCQGLISGKNCLLYPIHHVRLKATFVPWLLDSLDHFLNTNLKFSRFSPWFRTVRTPVLNADWFTNFITTLTKNKFIQACY